MPVRTFSAETLRGKAIRTHKQPWLRASRVIAWLEIISSQLERFTDLPERQFIEVVRDYVYSAKFSPPGQDPYPSPISSLDKILAALYIYHSGKSPERIPIFCQACVLAMGAILDAFGIICRETAIMNPHGREREDSFLSHALLEVWNSELEQWELQDPTLNLAYGLKTEKGARHASVWELFAKPAEEIACIIGDKEYFDLSEDFRKLHLQKALSFIRNGMFNVVASNYLSYNPVIILNLDGIDLEKKCQHYGNKNLVEIINNLYCYGGHPPIIQGWRAGQWITLPPEKSFNTAAWIAKFG